MLALSGVNSFLLYMPVREDYGVAMICVLADCIFYSSRTCLAFERDVAKLSESVDPSLCENKHSAVSPNGSKLFGDISPPLKFYLQSM